MLIRCHINCMSHSQAGEEPGNKTMHTYLLLLCLKAKLIMQKYQYIALPPITECTNIQIRNWCLPTSLRWSIWTKLAIVSANSSCVWRLQRLLSTRTHWVNTHVSQYLNKRLVRMPHAHIQPLPKLEQFNLIKCYTKQGHSNLNWSTKQREHPLTIR